MIEIFIGQFWCPFRQNFIA